jgi:undecaprenyl-diphosphatase
MSILQGLWLSLIQSFTEFLPISSSGHLLFFKAILHHEDIPLISDIVMHLGSLVAVVIYFRAEIRRTFKNAVPEIRDRQPDKPHSKFIFYVLISTVVTFIGYLLFQDPIEAQFKTPHVLRITYLLTTLILLSTVLNRNRQNQPIAGKSIFFAVLIGLVQALAILPGVSRSGMTISVMLMLRTDRSEAAYYSFMLFIPAALGAFLFGLSDIDNFLFLRTQWMPLLISFLSTIILSTLFLWLLTWIVRKGRLYLFSVYTLGMAVLSWILF